MSAHRSRSSAVLSIVLLSAFAAWLQAQSPHPTARLLDSARAMIAKATPVGDIPALKNAQALLERAATVAPNDPWLTHYLGFALYRQATLSFGMGRDNYAPILERADSVLERSAIAGSIAESYALRSGVIGMMIGSNPIKGMTLGPKSAAQMEKALELAPRNPRVWLLRAIGAFNTPAMFGGGMDRAEEYLLKSIALFSQDKPLPPAPTWGLHEAYTWLGRVYANEDKIPAARTAYHKALEIEPNDMWVRSVLMPALDKKK
jgi:tetratricopeptide (TPR) repeat protein